MQNIHHLALAPSASLLPPAAGPLTRLAEALWSPGLLLAGGGGEAEGQECGERGCGERGGGAQI